MIRARFVSLAMCLVLASVAMGGSARAQTPAPAAPADEKLIAAKELFRQGVALFNAGDLERALDLFLRSRAVVPSGKNTTNAAICLERLGRFDEAIELYEEVIARFASEVDEADRRAVAATLTDLRRKVASIDVSSNVDGAIVVDGRARARLPLAAPIRVLPGEHLVRVLKDGYATAEAKVEAKSGATARVDLLLKPLAAAGQLRVDDPESPGAAVFVDGAQIGETPWQGTLGPGNHVVWLQRGDFGTAPTNTIVLQGQSRSVSLHVAALGATTRVEADPSSAEVEIDGVDVGRGAWEGRLPIGQHRATAIEAGYFDATVTFASTATGGGSRTRLHLKIDPRHPRWPKPIAGHFFVLGWAGGAFGTSPGGGADKLCTGACSSSDRLIGGGGGARLGYRFPNGLGLEIGGGYLALGTHIHRKFSDSNQVHPTVVDYTLDDDVIVRGPFGAAGASYRFEIGRSFSIAPALSLGVMGASTRDSVTGTLTTNGMTVPATLDGQNSPVLAVTLFAEPEVRAAIEAGGFTIGASFTGIGFLLRGPNFPYGLLRPVGPCEKSEPATCTAESAKAKGERSFGNPIVFMPALFAGYAF